MEAWSWRPAFRIWKPQIPHLWQAAEPCAERRDGGRWESLVGKRISLDRRQGALAEFPVLARVFGGLLGRRADRDAFDHDGAIKTGRFQLLENTGEIDFAVA